MARFRWTLALILICLPILATVITAFRVRDLPTLQDSLKAEFRKQKCEHCDVDDVKVGQKLHSVKTESVKRYEELKRAVRDKQQELKQKTGKLSLKFEDDSDDDDNDDDDDFDFLKSAANLKKEEPSKIVKAKKGISDAKSKKHFSLGDNDDDDDENEDDDFGDDKIVVTKTKKLVDSKKKHESDKKQSANNKIKTTQQKDEDDDDEDEDDVKIKKQKQDEKEKQKKTNSKSEKDSKKQKPQQESKEKPKSFPKKSNIDDDDDDDEDDDGGGIFGGLKKLVNNVVNIDSQKNDKGKDPPAPKDKIEKVTENKLKSDKDDDEDDDDDDGDEDDGIFSGFTKLLKNVVESEAGKMDEVKEKREPKGKISKVFKEKLKSDKDEDDDDEDGGFFSGFTKLLKNVVESETEKMDEVKEKREPKEKISKVSKEKLKSDKDDDGDDDDDDGDEDGGFFSGFTKSLKNLVESEAEKMDEVKEKREPKGKINKVSKEKPKSVRGFDDNDDDDDDDEDDDGGLFGGLTKLAQSIVEKPKPEKQTEKKAEPKKETPKKTAEPPKKETKSAEKIKGETKDIKDKSKGSAPKDSSKKDVKQKEVKTKDEPKKDKKQDSKEKSDKDNSKKDKSSSEKLVSSKEFFAKSESPLKDVTDAMYRRNLLQSEFEDFYAFLPTFAPNFSRIHNPECRRHGQILLRQLRGTKLWALNMLDATAKVPSGILQGNGIQLGDFDQCLGSRAKVQLDTGSVVKVQGKYCLARLEVKAEHPELEAPVHLAQAKNLIRSRLEDPGHFVPRFSTLSWGVCVPSACEPTDVEIIIKDAVKHYQHKSGFVLRVKVDEQDCHVEDADWWEDWMELPTLVTLGFYGIIILLVLIATLQDFLGRRKSEEESTDEGDKPEGDEEPKEEGEEKEKEGTGEEKKESGFISSFSLYHTLSKLTAPGTDDEIACIHGIRAIATLALLGAHKFLPVAVTPYTNRLKITEIASSSLWSWWRAGWMFTDCFLLLSGALTAHRISTGDTGAPYRLFTRYLRLTPALLALVLFYAYVWDNISSGPMWGTLVTKNAEVCQEGWLWNILYVQNYFGFEDMCAPQTHQLALDMQLTILGGIIVWVMQVKKEISWFLMPSLHAIAVYSRYSTVSEHRLTMLAYHGVTVSQLYRTARLSYTSVIHRSTPYLVGISLGLALKNPSEHGKIIRTLGWLISAVLWCSVWYAGMDSGYTTYKYNADTAAQYAAFAPVASAFAIAWVIYAVHTGGDGIISKFLCCRPLVLVSRLSYALYLCQFVVYFTNVGVIRNSTEFTLVSVIDVKEISALIISSIILTVTFVIPMQSLHKVFKFSSKPENEVSEDSEKIIKENGEVQEEKESTEKEGQTTKIEEPEEEIIELPQIKSRQHLLAHREVLEEIPEVEIEYEAQREMFEGLEEILEEEEEDEMVDEEIEDRIEEEEEEVVDKEIEDRIDEEEEEDGVPPLHPLKEIEDQIDEDDLEIIEEEGGEDIDDFWADREEYIPRRSFSRQDDRYRERDRDESEWTANGNSRYGAQNSRYTR